MRQQRIKELQFRSPWGPDVGLSCQAGEGGYLVFVDTNYTEPKVAVFKVDPDQGIWPNIPYQWKGGWKTPCPDWERMNRDGFERGMKFEREHPGQHELREDEELGGNCLPSAASQIASVGPFCFPTLMKMKLR